MRVLIRQRSKEMMTDTAEHIEYLEAEHTYSYILD